MIRERRQPLPDLTSKSNSPEPLRWYDTNGAAILKYAQSRYSQQFLFPQPDAGTQTAPTTPAKKTAKPKPALSPADAERAHALRERLLSEMADRLDDGLAYGPVGAIVSDLAEHLRGSGWSQHELLAALHWTLFPELQEPPPWWDGERMGIVPTVKKGAPVAGGADEVIAFFQLMKPRESVNERAAKVSSN